MAKLSLLLLLLLADKRQLAAVMRRRIPLIRNDCIRQSHC